MWWSGIHHVLCGLEWGVFFFITYRNKINGNNKKKVNVFQHWSLWGCTQVFLRHIFPPAPIASPTGRATLSVRLSWHIFEGCAQLARWNALRVVWGGGRRRRRRLWRRGLSSQVCKPRGSKLFLRHWSQPLISFLHRWTPNTLPSGDKYIFPPASLSPPPSHTFLHRRRPPRPRALPSAWAAPCLSPSPPPSRLLKCAPGLPVFLLLFFSVIWPRLLPMMLHQDGRRPSRLLPLICSKCGRCKCGMLVPPSAPRCNGGPNNQLILTFIFCNLPQTKLLSQFLVAFATSSYWQMIRFTSFATVFWRWWYITGSSPLSRRLPFTKRK